MTPKPSPAPELSPTEPDWSREAPRKFWDPSRKLIKAMRRCQALSTRAGPLARIRSKIAMQRYRFWTIVTQAEIPISGDIGGGLKLPHPNGVVIHPRSKVGPNCVIFQQVTLGTSGAGSGAPVIGGGVDIGAGARILGPIHIGNHAVIGANAVVLEDVPEGAIVVGIPARIVGTRA